MCVYIYIYTVELGLTYVSFLQGRRVIYTITGHSYNGSHSLASFHNDKLLLGWCSGEHNFSVVSVTVSVACFKDSCYLCWGEVQLNTVSLWYIHHQMAMITCLNIPVTFHLIVGTIHNHFSFLEGGTVPSVGFQIHSSWYSFYTKWSMYKMLQQVWTFKCSSESFIAVAIMCCDFMTTEACNESPEVEDTRGKWRMYNVPTGNELRLAYLGSPLWLDF